MKSRDYGYYGIRVGDVTRQPFSILSVGDCWTYYFESTTGPWKVYEKAPNGSIKMIYKNSAIPEDFFHAQDKIPTYYWTYLGRDLW